MRSISTSEIGMTTRKTVYRYELQPDGTVKNGKLFFDFTSIKGEDAIDGIKVDVAGNVYVSGSRRLADLVARRKASRHDRHAAACPQHGLGRWTARHFTCVLEPVFIGSG